MDSLFEAFESVSETVSAQLPEWLGDDPEEQEAHVHTRQARWEVLAAEASAGEGLDGGAGYSFRRPKHDDDNNDDDTPSEADNALSDSHNVYGVSSLPPRPLPADAEERAARLKAAAAAQSARGRASPVAGSSSTPTGSSWASRPPPGSPAARIERARLLTQFRNEQRGVTMLCGDGSSMEVTFLQKGTLEPNCLYITLALAFPYVPPTLALATRIAHPWVQASPVSAPSGSAGSIGAVRCAVSSPGLRGWDPATSTLGGVVRDVLSQLGATSRMTGEVVTLDRLDAEETPLDGGADGRHAGQMLSRNEEEATADDEWVPDELRDVAAALNDVAALLGGEGDDDGGEAMPDEATALRLQAQGAAAALAKSMATQQPRGWSDDEPDEQGAAPGGDGDSSDEEQQQPPVRSPAPTPAPMQTSPLRRPLIKPLTLPDSPGSVAALTAMLSSSPPQLAAQTRLEAVRVLDSALLDLPSPSPSLPSPLPTPSKLVAEPPPLAPRRTQFLVPKRRRGDHVSANSAHVTMVETSDGGGGDSDAGATSAAGDVSSEDERHAQPRPHADGANMAASAGGVVAGSTRADQLRDLARRLSTTLRPAAAAAAARSARRLARAASSRVSLVVSSLALTWLLACAVGATARATLPHAGMSACSLIASLPRDHPALAAVAQGEKHSLSRVELPPNANADVAQLWASPAGIAACSAHHDVAAGEAALGGGDSSLWASLSCGPPALVVATSRSWTQPLRVTASFSREGALVLGALTATSPAASGQKGRLLTHLRATPPSSCPAAVATSAWGLTRLAGGTPAGLALLASKPAGSVFSGTHVAAVLRALAPSSPVATWTGPLGGTLLCTSSLLHTAAAAGAGAEAVDVLLRNLYATSSPRRGILTPALLLRGLRCGPAVLPALFSETPLGAAARRRHGAIVDALSEALDASAASRGARSSAAALGKGTVYGPWGLVTSQSPAALVLMAPHHQQGDTPPGQVLASLLTAHGDADGRLTRGGVALGPWSLLGHVTPLGLALLHGDAAAVASLLRLGAQHGQRGACASLVLIPSGITSCASLATLGDKSLPPLLAAWDEHVALEAADRMRVLMDVAIGGGFGGESASTFAQHGGEHAASSPPRSREEVLLQAELEAQEEADLVLRVTASLARAKQTLASVGGSDTSAKGGLGGDGDVTSVEALEATAAQLVNARRGAERAAAEVMAAAARLAAESAAEEASARRQAAQLAAYNARLSRQQARDMVAAEEEEGVAAGADADARFDSTDFYPDSGTQLGGLAVYDDEL